jgi:hypothetical protein
VNDSRTGEKIVMRKMLVSLLLVVGLGLPVMGQQWIQDYFVDEFGDKTENSYIRFSGSVNASSITNAFNYTLYYTNNDNGQQYFSLILNDAYGPVVVGPNDEVSLAFRAGRNTTRLERIEFSSDGRQLFIKNYAPLYAAFNSNANQEIRFSLTVTRASGSVGRYVFGVRSSDFSNMVRVLQSS